jgi:formate/nitrite transporter FocA (FNT family)
LAFILAGFNHCIADFFYLLAGKQFSISWIFTVIGNIIGGLIFTKFNPLLKEQA